MFSEDLRQKANELIALLRGASLEIATAESCTGGLLAALLTESPGASAVVDRGFVTYSNDAKIEMLGVRADLIAEHGAVSRQVAIAMADGALLHSQASLAVSITGLAGPGGGTADKPVGLVHIAAARIGTETLHREHRFADLDRSGVRLCSLAAALALAAEAANLPTGTSG